VSRLDVPVAVDQQGAILPATLSPSRASDYLSCQLKFFFTAVERWRAPPTEHTALGNLVHEVIEMLYLLDAPDRTRARAGRLLDEAWTDWSVKPDDVAILNPQIRQKAELSLDGLFALEGPDLPRDRPRARRRLGSGHPLRRPHPRPHRPDVRRRDLADHPVRNVGDAAPHVIPLSASTSRPMRPRLLR
jgi:hypothetical protein